MPRLTPLVTATSCVYLLGLSESFQMPPSRRSIDRRISMAQNDEPDLFDYFDPLLSPHAYPNGVTPESSPLPTKLDSKRSNKPLTEMDLQRLDPTTISMPAIVDKSYAKSSSMAIDRHFFDPLLSPHMYPNRTPDQVLVDVAKVLSSSSPTRDTPDTVGLSESLFPSIDTFESPMSTPWRDDRSGIDPNFFDPRLSPHLYPNGTPDKVWIDASMRSLNGSSEQVASNGAIDPSEMVSLLSSVTAFDMATDAPPSLSSNQVAKPQEIASPQVFDPLLSPHMYPNGTPNRVVGDENLKPVNKRVGVLLMDHGSRNQGSNDRLHEIARLYQASVDSEQIVVAAAHMELASPSIPEGLQFLLTQNVQEIVCHPYFLSAQGRHVSEDIPAIIGTAVESLGIEIPISTTEPVGSQTDIMIQAIQALVKQNSLILKT